MKLLVKKLDERAVLPKRANPTDAGADLCALEDGYIMPGQRMLVDTGLAMAIPEGHYGRIADRSGLAAKKGVHVLGGVVDSLYRGPVKVILLNTSDGGPENTFSWKAGERIAQIVIEKCALPEFVETDNLDDTPRGVGGFGSTGS